MAYGIQIQNSNYKTQLTDTGRMLRPITSGSVGVVNDPSPYADGQILVPGQNLGSQKLVLLRPPNGIRVLPGINSDNINNWTKFNTVGQGGTCYYYVCQMSPVNPTNAGYGIEILNSAGQVAYSSNYASLSITSTLMISAYWGMPTGLSYYSITNAPHTGQTLYMVTPNLRAYWLGNGSSADYYSVQVGFNNDSQAVVSVSKDTTTTSYSGAAYTNNFVIQFGVIVP